MTAPNAGFVWSIADLLRGPYKPKQYGTVILPFTVLARLDAVLRPAKQQVLQAAGEAGGKPEMLAQAQLRKAAGQQFYNTSQYSLRNLGDPAQLAANLKDYLDGFDPETREIFEKFDFYDTIRDLDGFDLLAMVTKRFADLDVHPDRVTNTEMGTLFEELIRRFMESSKETAGEHFTPREVIKLMVELLFTADDEALSQPHVLRQVYDPTAGTGGMLSVADEWLRNFNPDAKLTLAGQELNPESYAMAKADMLIKGQNVNNIINGDTLVNDGHESRTFTYCLSNPPFGVDWKVQEKAVRAEQARGEFGRFAPGLPPVSDGSMLFLLHLVAKMRPKAEGGGRAAIVLNGSPLFTGGAGSGPSEIRRWLLENDLVEAIIGLPTEMFYNTGISTYVWVLTNRKPSEREGKVQLIDATSMWVKMRKSLGAKRRMLSEDDIATIVRLYGAFEDADPKFSKVYRNEDFGYRTITVERPLRLNFSAHPSRIDKALTARAIAKLDGGTLTALRAALGSVDATPVWTNQAAFEQVLGPALGAAGVTLKPAVRKALIQALSEPDREAETVTGARGRIEPDPSLRDTENVPLDQDIDAYFNREVKPHVPAAWIDREKTRIGYEIPFTRHFYKYVPPRPLAEIDADIQRVIGEIEDLFAEVKA
ncbi:type I restriction-modification system subunit M [Georgenia subflava]|uniref:site-specific DNA-methyltransferase (adenine-specific) n=1 Tax=Georgenia subflava TaxID=1622177 RepID=A0A6N7EJJ5_9MICO|nr:class I SAM-dependent DNA methyltransferase [Georgenia subflava]MPV36715.1 N-6 DNA methylase [Georgenia subflava]